MKTVLFIVGRGLRQHLLSSIVAAIAVALSCGLLMAVFSIQAQTHSAMTSGATRFDAVLGARGSSLQLVLNSVFHLDVSPGNIPYTMYLAMKKDVRVLRAVPLAVGDNYRGFRLVATQRDFFINSADQGEWSLERGRFFDESKPEAVLGSFAALKTGLRIGDVFNSYHGTVFDEKQKHDEQFVVTGILKPTNTPADRAIWIPLESFYRLSGHQLKGGGEVYIPQKDQVIPDELKEVSAVLIKFKAPQMGLLFDQMINRQGKAATLAWPIEKIMADFLNKMGWFHQVLTLLAYIMAFVAAAAILAGVYNSMNERRRAFAILRALGARRRQLFAVILTEASAIAAIGALAGFAVYAFVMMIAAAVIRSGTGVVIDILYMHPVLLLAPVGIIILGALAGLVPALKAYRSSVADNLTPLS